jgi:four helix bundle protein
MRTFRTMVVWERAHQLGVLIFTITRDFDIGERYGLTSRIRNTCTSIAANIAAGCGTGSDAAFQEFCLRAMAFACALESCLLLARDIGLMSDLDHERVEPDLIEVKRMLGGLIRKLRGDS